MKYRNKNRAPNRTKLGAMKSSAGPRTITMNRVSFDENGQLIGTEQVEATVQFDPRNACYHIMIDDTISDDTDSISDNELVQLLEAISSDGRATGQGLPKIMTKKEAN